MHEVLGFFCKSVISWINAKITAAKKTLRAETCWPNMHRRGAGRYSPWASSQLVGRRPGRPDLAGAGSWRPLAHRSAFPSAYSPNVSSPLLCCWTSKFRPMWCFFFRICEFLYYPENYCFTENPLHFMHLITPQPCIGLKQTKYVKCLEFCVV